MQDVDDEIQKHKDRIQYLESSGGSGNEMAQEYAMLAIFIQIKDARYHVAGGLSAKHEALEAFQNALKYCDNSDPLMIRLRVSVHHRMGVLLKMMGHGEEAIESYKLMHDLSPHSFDKSFAWFYTGEALSMLGRVRESVEYYRKALEIRPDRVLSYYPMIKGISELKEYTKEDWKELLNELEDAFQKYTKGPKVDHQDELSFTYMPEGEDTSLYWSIFEVLYIISIS